MMGTVAVSTLVSSAAQYSSPSASISCSDSVQFFVPLHPFLYSLSLPIKLVPISLKTHQWIPRENQELNIFQKSYFKLFFFEQNKH